MAALHLAEIELKGIAVGAVEGRPVQRR